MSSWRASALTAQAKAGSDNLDVELSAPKLDITAEKASGETVLLTAKLAGADRNGNGRLKLSALEGSAKALKIAALTLEVDAKQKDNTVKGTLSTPVARQPGGQGVRVAEDRRQLHRHQSLHPSENGPSAAERFGERAISARRASPPTS